MTQCEKILRYMRDVGPITQLDAAKEFGCYRLGARIWDLKKARHPEADGIREKQVWRERKLRRVQTGG